MAPALLRVVRRAVFSVFVTFAAAAATATAALACDTTMYGTDINGALWQFTPPAAAATQVAGNPVLPYGTIARGVFSGNIFAIQGSGSNSALYLYNLTTSTQSQIGTFPNTSFLYASGFSSDGYGYVMSSSEVYTFADSTTPNITYVGVPQTTSGPPISAFNSGDLAIDVNNNGWVILSNNATGLSYLYQISWGSQTLLSPIAQVTLGGSPYTAADLYSLAFEQDGTIYTSSGGTGTLYSVDLATGALTSLGAQGKALLDFASCPYAGQPTFRKTGPTKIGNGELVPYALTASLAGTATAALSNVTLQDAVPAGITVLSTACTVANGAVCAAPVVSGQQVTASISTLPPGASATLRINGRNAGLPLGTTVNVGQMMSQGITWTWSASTNVVPNTVLKTVANVTQGTPAATSMAGTSGDVLEYVISYTNSTNAPLQSFALKDNVPANTLYVAGSAACVVTAPPLSCTPSGPSSGALTWTFSGGALQPGQTVSVKYRSTIV